MNDHPGYDHMDFESAERPKQEPSAQSRALARASRDMYVSMIDEGFTESEAMAILGTVIAAAITRPQ